MIRALPLSYLPKSGGWDSNPRPRGSKPKYLHASLLDDLKIGTRARNCTVIPGFKVRCTNCCATRELASLPGIEPGLPDRKSGVLSRYTTGTKWCLRSDSHRHDLLYKRSAFLCLPRRSKMVPGAGNDSLRSPCGLPFRAICLARLG